MVAAVNCIMQKVGLANEQERKGYLRTLDLRIRWSFIAIATALLVTATTVSEAEDREERKKS